MSSEVESNAARARNRSRSPRNDCAADKFEVYDQNIHKVLGRYKNIHKAAAACTEKCYVRKLSLKCVVCGCDSSGHEREVINKHLSANPEMLVNQIICDKHYVDADYKYLWDVKIPKCVVCGCASSGHERKVINKDLSANPEMFVNICDRHYGDAAFQYWDVEMDAALSTPPKVGGPTPPPGVKPGEEWFDEQRQTYWIAPALDTFDPIPETIVSEASQDLEEKGYCVVRNVLRREEVEKTKKLFFEWYNSIPGLKDLPRPHGIFKHHEVSHQKFAWYVKTNRRVRDLFGKLLKVKDTQNDLVTSFDGCCYMEKGFQKVDTNWTHTDQSSSIFECIQGFVALTKNKKRTLIVYEGSHKKHAETVQASKDHCIRLGKTIKSNWHIATPDSLEKMAHSKRCLELSPGDVALWDSRTFHQNEYGLFGEEEEVEERLIQYTSYKRKHDPGNTLCEQKKRRKYFLDKRVTSHTAYKLKVNGLQPQTYGNDSRLIDYSLLSKPDLTEYQGEIDRIL